MSDEVRAEMARMEGETEQEWKRRCQRIYMRLHRAKLDPEEEARKRRAAYAANPAIRAKGEEWRRNNPEKAREIQRRYFEGHREERLAKLREWGEANPDRMRDAKTQYARDNRAYFVAAAAKIRAKTIQATPPWVDWKAIEDVYRLAKRLTNATGVLHEVDHIVPLNGRNVCGLHVPWNLQAIPKDQNRAKRNYLDGQAVEDRHHVPAADYLAKMPDPRNRSGHRGVSWHAKYGKWRATLQVNGRQVEVGRFATIEEAAAAREAAAKRLLDP